MGCGASKFTVMLADEPARACAEGLPQWEMSSLQDMASRFEKGPILGRGAFGECHGALDEWTGKKVAIKSIFKSNKRFKQHMLDREIQITTVAEHPNIVNLYEAHQIDGVAFLVMELVTGGDLLQRCIEVGPLQETDAAHISSQLLDAVGYLHKNGIAHRDLKPENVLVVSSDETSPDYWTVKITDFGLSVQRDSVMDNVMSTLHGTPEFAAPEVLRLSKDKTQPNYSAKIDIWAIGCIAYVLLSSRTPFGSNGNVPAMMEKIIEGKYHFRGSTWRGVSDMAVRFVKYLMQVDPQDRPNAEQAARHQFLVHGDKDMHEALSRSTTAAVAPDSVHRSFRNIQDSGFNSSLKLLPSSSSHGASSHMLMPLPNVGATDFIDQFGARSPPRSPVGRFQNSNSRRQSSPSSRPLHLQERNPSHDSRTPSLKGTPPVSPGFSVDNGRGNETSIPKMVAQSQISMGIVDISMGIVDELHLDAACEETDELYLADGKKSPTGLGLGSKGGTFRMPKICSPMPPQLPIHQKPGATRQFSVSRREADEEFERQVQPELGLWRKDHLDKGAFVREIDDGEPGSRLFEDLPG